MADISVIIPLYNHARELKRSLASLAKQTVLPAQVIIVDDGSTDGGTQGLEELSWPFALKIIKQDNLGASAARNAGFKESNTELIIFWDADTIARPCMLEILKAALQNSTADYAYCNFKYGLKLMRGRDFNATALLENNFIDTTTLVRRAALEGLAGPFDESLSRFQDWDLWLTLLEKNKSGIFVPRVLYQKIVGFRRGISAWRPRWFYKIFSKSKTATLYQTAKLAVLTKHGLAQR